MNDKEDFTIARRPALWNRCLALFLGVAGVGFTLTYANIDINFSSKLDAVNQQSDMTPMDTSFTFELGTFDTSIFTPDASNTNLWMSNWTAVPGSSTAEYTQAPLPSVIAPNTGESSQFSGSVTLTSNGGAFTTSAQGFIWGFDDRGTSGTGEWVLITNPTWTYPLVTGSDPQFPGVDWSVTDPGTIALFGSVNPDFPDGISSGDPAHIMSASVILAPVPEPSTSLLLCGGIGALLLRRRRP